MRSEWAEDPSVKAWHEMELKRRINNLEQREIGLGEIIAKRFADNGDEAFEQALDSILAQLRETMLRKHHDYGPLNIANAPGGAMNGLRVRMHDKLARINNLTDKGVEPENESLLDSFLDIANYGIIGLMVLRGQWPGSEK